MPFVNITEIDHSVPPPEKITEVTEWSDGGTYFPATGKKRNPDVLFVGACPLEEELDSRFSPATLMKGGPGNLLRRTAMKHGLTFDKNACYTVLCRYPLPRKCKLKPSATDIKRCAPYLERDIRRIKPKVLAAMGAEVFKTLTGHNIKFDSVRGGWFTSLPEFGGLPVLVMDPLHLAQSKPEYLSRQATDLTELARSLKLAGDREDIPLHYTHLDTLPNVARWISQMLREGWLLYSVDCEWAGSDFLSGRLRMIQFCWKPGYAVAIQFIDEKGKSCWSDDERTTIKKMLGMLLNRPQVKYIGHNWTADALWMDSHLGLDTYRKCAFDTMYAMQTVDESADLKLERLSVLFTTLGRYDVELTLWKKKHRLARDEGYGKVPTDLLVPYALRDVDVVMRATPALQRLLEEDGTTDYYYNIRLPYVSDGFTHLVKYGMPLHEADVNVLRENFVTVQETLTQEFLQLLEKESVTLLHAKCKEVCDAKDELQYSEDEIRKFLDGVERKQGLAPWKEFLGMHYVEMIHHIEHWIGAKEFKIGSSQQKIRWLYNVKGLVPIRTTDSGGLPSIPWEKVEEIEDPEERAQYVPCVDKDAMQMHADQSNDTLLEILVELGSINKLVSQFLKDEGKGVEKFIRVTGRVHSNLLLTETNRPKSKSPNILNIPKRIPVRLKNAFQRAQDALGQKLHLHPIRWAFRGEFTRDMTQMGFTEVDFVTAEVFALAYLSGDMDLIAALTQPDPQYVLCRIPGNPHPVPIRVGHDPSITQIEPKDFPKEVIQDINILDVVRDERGEPMRPLRDVHWEMAEHKLVMGKPRELLEKGLHRDAVGKVGNFCIARGSPVYTHRGWKPIEKVEAFDYVWDGNTFVPHKGVVATGRKRVIYHDGVCATPNHVVWLHNGKKTTLAGAKAENVALARTFIPSLWGGAPQNSVKFNERSPTQQMELGLPDWEEETFDILEAGPQHRFVCNNRLVSNSIPYQAQGTLLERMIEIATGVKPEPGTGDALREAYIETKPVAWQYILDVMSLPETVGEFILPTGQKRHFHVHSADTVGKYYHRRSLASIEREASNAPMQGLVADTLARGVDLFLKEREKLKFQTTIGCPLYDAFFTYGPVTEFPLMEEVLARVLKTDNEWDLPGGRFSFGLEFEHTLRWACKPTEEEQKIIDDILQAQSS